MYMHFPGIQTMSAIDSRALCAHLIAQGCDNYDSFMTCLEQYFKQ